MSLRTRLAALERLARAGGHVTGEPLCPTCGGPGRSPITMFLLYEGEELRVCQQCRRPITEGGQPSGKLAVVMEMYETPVRSDLDEPRDLVEPVEPTS